jgi:hypothetical protein
MVGGSVDWSDDRIPPQRGRDGGGRRPWPVVTARLIQVEAKVFSPKVFMDSRHRWSSKLIGRSIRTPHHTVRDIQERIHLMSRNNCRASFGCHLSKNRTQQLCIVWCNTTIRFVS